MLSVGHSLGVDTVDPTVTVSIDHACAAILHFVRLMFLFVFVQDFGRWRRALYVRLIVVCHQAVWWCGDHILLKSHQPPSSIGPLNDCTYVHMCHWLVATSSWSSFAASNHVVHQLLSRGNIHIYPAIA